MSILSTNTRLIKVGQDYSAGSGISIEDKVISVTGEFGKTYSAGDNISIYNQGEQLYISSKDWSEDIANASANAYNEAVAQIPAPFDPSFISGQVDNKLDTTAFTAWQNGQYTTDLQTIESQISNKLDESAFSQVSGSFLTAINIPESATWNEVSQAYEQASATYLTSISIPESAVWQDVSTTVQTNSAQWAEGGSGDDEVNALVHSNSGNWNTVTDKLDTSSFINSINNFYPNSNPAGYITGVEIPESATWNEVSTTVQTNSAQWAECSSIPVSNSGNLYKVEFDGIDLYGYKSSTTIYSEPVYSSLCSQESTSIQNTQDPSWNNAAIDNFQWVGFDVISISSNVVQIHPSDYGNDGLTALNVYYKADYVYDNNNQQLPPLSGYIGKITLDNLLISSYIDKPSYFNDIKRCDEFRLWFSGNYYEQDILNKYICSIGTYVQSEPRTFEGIFVIPQSALPTYEYDTTNKISAINGSAIGGAEIVNHDNTLSGNGTVDSPLGVVPGYNETVLYDNYGNNTDLQLSESPLNFKQIELYCKGSNINGNNEGWGSMKIDNEQLSSTNYVMVNGGFCGGCSSPTTGNTYVMYALYTGCSGTNWKKTFGMATRGSYIDASNSGHFFIYKIVGINRKA